MKIDSVIPKELAQDLIPARVVGLDIGSRTAKGVIIADGSLYTAIIPTGTNMQETANELIDKLQKTSKVKISSLDYIVGTGYGRISMEFENIPTQIVTEISCHAMGAHYLNPKTRTIIDIGGQDCKAIKVDTKTGKVVEFALNDKCAAGTGRFLEKVAELLKIELDELGDVALKSTKTAEISSQCVVFAESEIISLKAKGEKKEDIAAGVHLATARRVFNLLNRVGIEPDIVFTGGVSKNKGMKASLESLLNTQFIDLPLDAIYAGALGAVVYGTIFLKTGSTVEKTENATTVDLTEFNNKIQAQQDLLSAKKNEGKRVGYLCNYTPLELLNAAGVTPVRLFHIGDPKTVSSGEIHTQSVFCDFTKSVLGAFREKDPLVSSLDKVYMFYTCDCMKKVGEAINEYYVPTNIYCLPRVMHNETSRDFYRTELKNLKTDLEELSGKTITDKDLKGQIKLSNAIRTQLTKISDLRKRANPPLNGGDFLDLVRGYYYLPHKELLKLYKGIYDKLVAVPDDGQRKLRLMMAGGIVADGDRRLLDLIEKDIGARVVVEDHCTGLRPFLKQIDTGGDSLAALAEGYLEQAPCTRMKPLEERVAFAGNLAEEYQVDGVVYAYLKFCPNYGMTKNLFLKEFQKRGIPVLEIPIDYSISDLGQLKTRVEAFVEVLNERDNIREELKDGKESRGVQLAA
ncbi:2-hydroxyacyl-CoA dehydratase [Methanosphaerula subterraneus]|uniref:2-hydroxyacyl-CoA dehydratase n=1 Tax=Methanosphaerula subterraneus TaxID=3350244 RepID=UPI003F86C5C6